MNLVFSTQTLISYFIFFFFFFFFFFDGTEDGCFWRKLEK